MNIFVLLRLEMTIKGAVIGCPQKPSVPEFLTFFCLFLLSDVIRVTVRRAIRQATDADLG